MSVWKNIVVAECIFGFEDLILFVDLFYNSSLGHLGNEFADTCRNTGF